MPTVKIVISGKVQGVGFRFHSQRQARQLGIQGYAHNLPNGQVEVLAQGDEAALTAFIDWLAIGPPTADVYEVKVLPNEDENCEGFSIG